MFSDLQNTTGSLYIEIFIILDTLLDNSLLAEQVAEVREQLDELSDIQLQEGRRELYESKKAISAANLFTQLEIAAWSPDYYSLHS